MDLACSLAEDRADRDVVRLPVTDRAVSAGDLQQVAELEDQVVAQVQPAGKDVRAGDRWQSVDRVGPVMAL